MLFSAVPPENIAAAKVKANANTAAQAASLPTVPFLVWSKVTLTS